MSNEKFKTTNKKSLRNLMVLTAFVVMTLFTSGCATLSSVNSFFSWAFGSGNRVSESNGKVDVGSPVSMLLPVAEPKTQTSTLDFNRLVATKDDMRLLLDGSCSYPFSKYIFKVSTEYGQVISSGIFESSTNIANIGRFMIDNDGINITLHMRGADGTGQIGFCGGSLKSGRYIVDVLPGTYIPTALFPWRLPKDVAINGSVNGRLSVIFPESWVGERKLVFYLHTFGNSLVTTYGNFTTVPEMRRLLTQGALNKSREKGETLYVINGGGEEDFVLIGHRTRN